MLGKSWSAAGTDGVGFDVLGDVCSSDLVPQFLGGGRALGDDLEVGLGDRREICALHQQPAAHALEVGLPDGAQGRGEDPHVLLGFQQGQGLGGVGGGDQDFQELGADGFGGGGVHRAIEGDDAAEGGGGIGGEGL